MNLQSYRIGNFKSFGSIPQEIPLKPITLIFGANSVGKSSVLHSLLWLHDSLALGDYNVRFPRLAQEQVDLGGFWQFAHQKQSSTRVIYGLSLPPEILPEATLKWLDLMDSVSVEYSVGRVPGDDSTDPSLVAFELSFDGRVFLRASRQTRETWGVNLLDITHPVAMRLAHLARCSKPDESGGYGVEMLDYQEQLEELSERIGIFLAKGSLRLRMENDHPVGLEFREMPNPLGGLTEAQERFLSDVERGGYSDLVSLVADTLPEQVSVVLRHVETARREQLSRLNYVPPLRKLPPRFFDPSVGYQDWEGILNDPELVERVNDWLGGKQLSTRYSLEIAEYVPVEEVYSELPKIFESRFLEVMTTQDVSDDLRQVLEELHSEWEETDKYQLLQSYPDLRDSLIEEILEDMEEGDFYHQPENWDNSTQKEKRNYAADELENSFESDYVPEHWLENLFSRHVENLPGASSFMEAHFDRSIIRRRMRETFGSANTDSKRELVLRQLDLDTVVSLQDVGVGISQVLPVLLKAYEQKEKLIAIEQPELHIHPALQAELGDLFIESALGENKNKFLLETHSEHLILRILRRIRETTRRKLTEGVLPVTSDDVAVLYVSPGEDGAVVKNLRINEHGRFQDDWPNGFFEERFNEEF